jgi:hypothetical protein
MACVGCSLGFFGKLRRRGRKGQGGRQVFFFEKKKQKTSARWRTRPLSSWPRVARSKSFLVLFFKKEHFF